jgi:hypothetical protein
MLSYLDYSYYVGLSKRITGIAKALSSNGVTVEVLAPIACSEVVVTDYANYTFTFE